MNRDQTEREQASMAARNEGWTLDRAHERDDEDRLDDTRDVREGRDGRDDIEARERMARAGSATVGREASWQEIKGRFVDDPAGALAAAEDCVKRAVAERVRALQDEAAAVCARERDEDDASTEGLRTRLLRYEQYCERLAGSSALH